MLSRIAAFIDAGVQVGVATFACTPDTFGDLLAVAIDGGARAPGDLARR